MTLRFFVLLVEILELLAQTPQCRGSEDGTGFLRGQLCVSLAIPYQACFLYIRLAPGTEETGLTAFVIRKEYL